MALGGAVGTGSSFGPLLTVLHPSFTRRRLIALRRGHFISTVHQRPMNQLSSQQTICRDCVPCSTLIARKNSGPLLPVSGTDIRLHAPRASSILSGSSKCSAFKKADDQPVGTWVLCLLFAIACGALVTWLVIRMEAESHWPMISTSKLEVDETQRFGVGYAATRSLNSAKPPVVNFAGKTTHAHASSPDIAKQMYTGLFKMLAIDVNGHPRTFSEYAGKVTLVVNIDNSCAQATMNYRGLQYLQDKYRPQGFEILAFPTDEFCSADAPSSSKEIYLFAKQQYAITFTMFEKTRSNGRAAHPVYKFLKRELPKAHGGGDDMQVKGGFQKFLVNRRGQPVAIYGADRFELGELEEEIKTLLREPRPFS